MNSRLATLNGQFGPQATKGKAPPTLNVFESMNLDQHLRKSAVEKRKATAKFMDEIYEQLMPYYLKKEFPHFAVEKMNAL